MRFPHILQALYLAHSIRFRQGPSAHPLGPVLLQGQTCSELCQAHYMAGNANREDVFHLIGRIQGGVHGGVLRRERGNYCAYEA
jgi:hypothetical protein